MKIEPHFRNCQINHKFQGKDCCEKRKKNTKILFRNYSSRLARAFSTTAASRRATQTARAAEEMFMMRKLPRTSLTSGNAGSIPK